jgi:hypothetical protein
MLTEKVARFHNLTEEIRKIICNSNNFSNDLSSSCLQCGKSDQSTIDRVAETLNKYGIETGSVTAEMLTLTDNFAFKEKWMSKPQSEHSVSTLHFFAACYKFLK